MALADLEIRPLPVKVRIFGKTGVLTDTLP